MPTNVTPFYQKAEEEYYAAQTNPEKLTALKKMLQLAPKHKGAERLLKQIKERIARLKEKQQKEKQNKKTGHSLSIKREGAAQIVLVGTTNTGKSTLLQELTGARVKIAEYEFTTKKPEIGVMDYKGIKLQLIEIPALTIDYEETDMGPTHLSIIKHADLMILFFNTPEEKKLLDHELRNIKLPKLVYNKQKTLPDELWKKLGLVKVYTKQPGKPKDYPPMALSKGSKVRDIASNVHKDFLKRFEFARIYGKSAKFQGQRIGLNHMLQDEDVVELHMD
jgi:small GTP-binding protein